MVTFAPFWAPATVARHVALRRKVRWETCRTDPTSIYHTDVHTFTTALLNFWCEVRFKIPMWAKAAKIVFSFTPSSGASERIFALVKTMFGEEGLSAMSDYIQAALMLRYAERTVG